MASNSHDAAHDAMMGGLIRRGLGGASHAEGSCPAPDILAAYYERSLDATESTQFETHLSTCSRCRERVAAMLRPDEQPATRRLWFWDWRLIGATVTALLVLTIWGARRTTFAPRPQTNRNQPLVAMSRPAEPPQLQSARPPQLPDAQQSAPAEKTLVFPKSLDRAIAKTRKEPEEKTRQNTKGSQEFPSEAESAAKNARSFEALKVAPAPKSADQTNRDADLKKQSTNEMAAAAPARSAPPTPMSTTAAPPESASKALSARAGAPMQQLRNAPLPGTAPAPLIAQAAEQRSGSTIIQTPDSKILWRIVSDRFIERTEDGGATWHGQVPASDAQFTSGSAPTSKVCWLVGRSGAIVVTKDAVHWKKIPPPIPADFVAVNATSDSAVIVTSADGQKFATRNQGKKWIPAN